MFYVTKEFTFDSAHQLRLYKGACARLHGHTYKIQVTLKAQSLTENGMVLDFKELNRIAKQKIVEKYDHLILNDIEPFTKINPTAENMSKVFYEIFREALNNDRIVVYSVKVWETPNSFAEYREE